jgi:signal transduction histidine kinase
VGSVVDIHERKIAEEAQQQLTHDLALANKELKAYNLKIHTSNTELQDANLALNRLNTDLDNFVYTVSHDLKAPLANLEGLLNLFVRKKSQLSEEDSQLLEMMSVSFNRFKDTIGGLIEVINSQQYLTTKTESVSVASVVVEVQNDLRELITNSRARIQHNYTVDLIPFARVNLHSIVLNLLSNAIKYRSAERELVINFHTYQLDQFIVLEVEDNGLGISPKQQQKLFSMFRRFHSHIEGTGVGLYIIKRLIENYGGKIEVDSKEGTGSTFRVYFRIH